MITVRKAYGSTIFQRMWRNGHERTRVDTHCDPALAADISNVNDGYFYHFVTERLERTLLPPSRTSHLVPRTSYPRTSHLAPRTSHLALRTSYLSPLPSYLSLLTSHSFLLTPYLAPRPLTPSF